MNTLTAAATFMMDGKRTNDDVGADEAGGTLVRPAKVARSFGADVASTASTAAPSKKEEPPRELLPAPYFYYRDFSMEADPDPLTPLTPPGRVPNFPAKMHAILSRPDLAEIVAWLPHGRSWRVLKPREFEIKVIPMFFEHAKFSSFVRQANGWGFRRVTQGKDRNSYYHEKFLRGLPHLCKTMKRPGVNEKKTADPEHEPDFYKISEENPVPDKADDESIMLNCTIQGGPKARMPIYCGPSGFAANQQPAMMPVAVAVPENQVKPAAVQQPQPMNVSPPTAAKPVMAMPPFMAMPSAPVTAPTTAPAQAAANPMAAFANPMAAFPMSSAASQFAAGFAAAAAFSQQHFSQMMSSWAAQQQQQQQASQQQSQQN